VCSYCSVGCEVVYEHKDDIIYKASSPKENEIPMCGKGKFGIEHINNKARLLEPKIRIKGVQTPVELDVALYETSKRLRSIQNMYGENQVAFVVSPKLTNEELLKVNSIAHEINTIYKGSFTIDNEPGIEVVLGENKSTVNAEELDAADLIISVGQLYEHHPAAGMKLRRLSNTKTIISASTVKTKTENWSKVAEVTDYEKFFASVLKALIEKGVIKKDAVSSYPNGQELLTALENLEVTKSADEVAESIKKAKKPIIIADENTVNNKSLKVLADITLLMGNKNKPHRGLMVLKAKSNSQGAWNVGFRTSGNAIKNALLDNKLKGLVVIGEDIVGNDPELKKAIDGLKFFAAFDIMENDTTNAAEYVLPLNSLAESNGTMTSADGTVRNVVEAIKPLSGMSNYEMFEKIAELLNAKAVSNDTEQYEAALYVPSFEGKEKSYVIYDTVEIAYLTNLKNNCINVK
jgi:formate dehydrogenase major subunit